MIKYYYKNLRAKKVGELDTYHPGCWVHVEAPTSEEMAFLIKQFKLDEGHVQDALDPDEMPRLEKEGDHTYFFVRYAFEADDRTAKTAPLLFIVGPDTFITIAQSKVPFLDRFITGKIKFATTQRTKLLLLLLGQIVDQYDVFINRIVRQIQITRAKLKGNAISNRHFIDFVMIEDELNGFLSAMLPMTAILRRLLLGRHIPLFEEDQDIVEDLMLNTEQSIEGCRSHVKSVVNIREAYATISSNNLNRSMKILTAATVLITLPNVVYGMYGMNITLPFQHEPWAYPVILGTSILLAIVVFVVARHKKIF